MPTDKERIDFLQSLNDRAEYTGKCVLRKSTTGRGWRLHENSSGYGETFDSVRAAIDDYMSGIEYTKTDLLT